MDKNKIYLYMSRWAFHGGAPGLGLFSFDTGTGELAFLQHLNETISLDPTYLDEEKKILYILFMFPEKYWKIANFYYNAGKAWISKRSQEKLNTIVEQKELRSNFLNLLADFCSIQN